MQGSGGGVGRVGKRIERMAYMPVSVQSVLRQRAIESETFEAFFAVDNLVRP